MVFGKKRAMEADVSVDEGMDAGINVYLGAGTVFEGRLEYSGAAQISGVFTGEIASKGSLSVGKGGQVQGELNVGQLNVSGRFQGTATCSGKAYLQREAVFDGDLHAPKLEMEAGAHFEGEIAMSQAGKGPSS